MISITLDGDTALFAKLNALQQNRVLRPPMTRSMGRLQSAMAIYPAPPSGSTYQRTGNYGREWTSEINENGDGITGVLGNAVRDKRGRSYGPYVGSKEQQSATHVGRWTNDEEAILSNMDAIESDFAQAIEGAI